MKKGFTLLELLAVIVILAIIAVIAIPIIINVISDTKTNSNKISIKNYVKSLELAINNSSSSNVLSGTTIFLDKIETQIKTEGSKISCEKADYDHDIILKNCKIEGVDNTFCYKEGVVYLDEECTDSLLYKGSNVNLIKNGYLEYGDNTNFSSFTYNNGILNTVISYNAWARRINASDDYIEIDADKKYQISVDLKSDSQDKLFAGGIEEYDVDKNMITAPYYLYTKGTLSTLTKDLKNGDTVVYLDNLDNWSYTEKTPVHQLGFIFWNYKDSTGYEYPKFTYSRNRWENLWTYDKVDVENNTITLKKPWDKGTFKAGTKLSQCNSGTTFNTGFGYSLELPSEFKNYSLIIDGRFSKNDGSQCPNNKFRSVTKYIKVYFTNTANVSKDFPLSMKNLELKEID